MKLIGMLDSPYVRRTAISLQLLGLPFEHVTADPALLARLPRPEGAPVERLRNGPSFTPWQPGRNEKADVELIDHHQGQETPPLCVLDVYSDSTF